jgi:hypothetical protein
LLAGPRCTVGRVEQTSALIPKIRKSLKLKICLFILT